MRAKPFYWIKRSGTYIAEPMPFYTVRVSRSDSFGGKFIVGINGECALQNGNKILTFDNEEDAMRGAHIEFEKMILGLIDQDAT